MGRVLFSLVLLLVLGALALFALSELDGGDPDGDRAPPQSARADPADASDGSGADPRGPDRQGSVDTERETVRAQPESEPPAVTARGFDLTVAVVRRVDLQPVGGARCLVTDGYLGVVLVSGATGPDGRYVTSLRPGTKRPFVVIRKDGFLQQVRLLEWPEPVEPVEPVEFQVILDAGVPLRGQVLDGATRQPLAGVEIDAYLEIDFAELAEGIFTDREGRFFVPGVPVSKPLTLTATLPGYRPSELSQSFESARADLLLLLFRGAAVEGVVHAPDGRLAESARVTVTVLPGASFELELGEQQVLTDERGFFRVEGLAFPARYGLSASSDLHGSGRGEPFELVRDRQLVRRDIQLRRSATELAVMVQDEGGRVVTELTLRLLDRDGMPPRSAETGQLDWGRGFALAAGWHVYAPIPEGSYQVIAEREGWPARSIRVEVQEGRRNEATIVLQSGVDLVGRVRNRAGEALTSIPLEFIHPLDEQSDEQSDGLTAERIEGMIEGDDRGLVRVRAISDQQGRFRLRGLPRRPGAVLVGDPRGSAGGLSSRYALLIEHPVVPGGAALELVLDEAPRVIGRFEPSEGLGLVSWLSRSGVASSGGDLRVDPQGRFELRFTRVDVRFDLILEHEAGAPFLISDLVLAAGETRDLGRLKIVSGGSVEGRVTDSGGRPIAAVAVEVAADDWDWWHETVTDRLGRFQLDHLPAVAGALRISPELQVGAMFRIENLGGVHRQNVVLYRPGLLEGRLLDRGGQPRAEVAVEALFQGQDLDRDQWSADTLTDGQGRFSLRLRPGRYLVHPTGQVDLATEVLIEEDGRARVLLGN